MSRIDILKKLYDQAMNYVFAYSSNYLMNSPRKGYEKEWQEANEIVDKLDDMLKEEMDKEEQAKCIRNSGRR